MEDTIDLWYSCECTKPYKNWTRKGVIYFTQKAGGDSGEVTIYDGAMSWFHITPEVARDHFKIVRCLTESQSKDLTDRMQWEIHR